MKPLHESLSEFLNESKTWTAQGDRKSVKFTAAELKRGNEAAILKKLNGAGFNLGSGHEEMVLRSDSSDFILRLVPYTGMMSREIRIRLNEEDPGVPSEEQSLGVQLYRQTAAPTIAI